MIVELVRKQSMNITNISALMLGLIIPIFLIVYITKRVRGVYVIAGFLAIVGLLEVAAGDVLAFDALEVRLFTAFPLLIAIELINYILMIIIIILSFYLWKKASK